jgi:hypothetical protein
MWRRPGVARFFQGEDEERHVTVDHEDRGTPDLGAAPVPPGTAVPAVPRESGQAGPASPTDPTDAPVKRRERTAVLIRRLVEVIRSSDDDAVEDAVMALSRRSRWLAPLGLIVGAFLMLFQGLRLIFTNWRLTLIQIIPAMWIWIAMLDIKVHVLHGREFHIIRGPVLIPCVLAVTLLTAASFFLNAVFAFAIAKPGKTDKSDIRAAFGSAWGHIKVIALWGCAVGLALSFSALIVTRWSHLAFAICQSIVVGIMMFCYLAVPARLVGLQKKTDQSRRDALAATAVGGAVGAVVCSPPYMLGRLGILMLGWHGVFWLGVIFLAIGVALQTGTVTAVKAVKFSAKIVGTRTLPADTAA